MVQSPCKPPSTGFRCVEAAEIGTKAVFFLAKTLNTRGDYTRALLAWHGQMVDIGKRLSPEDMADLLNWERLNLGSTTGTGDWPRWQEFGLPLIEDIEPIGYKRPPSTRKQRKAYIPEEIRWEVWERDDFRCRQCGARRFLRIDHIFPESLGGEVITENLQTLCHSCNSKKGTKIMPFQVRFTQ